MTITYYRYKITYGYMTTGNIQVRETPKLYVATHENPYHYHQIRKEDDDIPVLKDCTTYPYIDFYSTKDQSSEYAIRKMLEYFEKTMRRKLVCL